AAVARSRRRSATAKLLEHGARRPRVNATLRPSSWTSRAMHARSCEMVDTESAVRAYAAARQFASVTLERWLAQPAEDRAALLDLADRLRLGENQFRDAFDDLVAICARRGCGIAEVLRADELRTVLARQLGRNEAVKAVKSVLRRLRYPQLTAAEQRLAALGKSLRLPAGVSIEWPHHLAGQHIPIAMPP